MLAKIYDSCQRLDDKKVASKFISGLYSGFVTPFNIPLAKVPALAIERHAGINLLQEAHQKNFPASMMK